MRPTTAAFFICPNCGDPVTGPHNCVYGKAHIIGNAGAVTENATQRLPDPVADVQVRLVAVERRVAIAEQVQAEQAALLAELKLYANLPPLRRLWRELRWNPRWW